MGSSAFRKHHWETWNATIKIKSGWQILSEKWARLAKEKVRSTWGPRYFFLPYCGSRCGQTAMQKYGMLAALPCWLSFYVGGDLASYDTSCRCLVYWRKRVPPLVSCQAGRFSHLPPLPYFFSGSGPSKELCSLPNFLPSKWTRKAFFWENSTYISYRILTLRYCHVRSRSTEHISSRPSLTSSIFS